MKTNRIILTLFLFTIIAFTSDCTKPFMNGGMTVKLTDSPGDLSQVNVDITLVRTHYSDSRGKDNGWIDLHTRSGVYNLLDFRNGETAVITSNMDLAPGKIDLVQIEFGQHNSIVKNDGAIFFLQSNTAIPASVTIPVNGQIKSNSNEEVILDFNVEKSVIRIGGLTFENYVLNPVIEIKSVLELK